MKIRALLASRHDVPLAVPYSTSYGELAAVTLFLVELSTDGRARGLGAASPATYITGETPEQCARALSPESLEWLVGRDLSEAQALCREARARFPGLPAAQAALDGALHDAWAQELDRPLVELLGRAHRALPTAITLGIRPVEQALEELERRRAQGFRLVKLKAGRSVDEDIERVRRVRAALPADVPLIVDPNTGYTERDFAHLVDATSHLSIAFYEQPLKAGADLRALDLPPGVRRRLAADEAMIGPADALALAAPPAACGVLNIKLMKCGGIAPARCIGEIADAAGLDLMWGCMDESRVSITAALHAALSLPRTRYLDLDGSFDLQRDLAAGGFVFEDGLMRAADAPGLGLRLAG